MIRLYLEGFFVEDSFSVNFYVINCQNSEISVHLYESNAIVWTSMKNESVCVYSVIQKKVPLLNLQLLKIGTPGKGGVTTNRKGRLEMIRFQNIKVTSFIVILVNVIM